MHTIIHAKITNSAHPEYGSLPLPLPIPAQEYDRIVGMLSQLEIGDPVQCDCYLNEIDSDYGILQRLSGTFINIEELDYLAKRLDSFDDQETAQFQAMAHKLNITEMRDFINLTFCCQQATVINDFSDLEKIGKDHYLVISGGCCPVDEFVDVDGIETALLLIEGGTGQVTPYGVVYKKTRRVCNSPCFLSQRHKSILRLWSVGKMVLPRPLPSGSASGAPL